MSIHTSFWSRIPKTNSWLFYTQPKICTIICTNPEESLNIEISGMSRLTKSSRCEIHNLGTVMFPLINNKEMYSDLVHSSQLNNMLSILSEMLKTVILQNITNLKLFKIFESLFHHSVGIENHRYKSSKPLQIVRPEIRVNIIYTYIYIYINSSVLF